MKPLQKPTVAVCVVTLFLLMTGLSASAQKHVDCAKLMKRQISADSSQMVMKNVLKTPCFGLDTLDRQFFGQGPVLGTLMMKLISDNKKPTYGNLLAAINKVKTDTSYTNARSLMQAQMKLNTTKANATNWDSCVPALKLIGSPNDVELEKFHQFVLTNQAKNYTFRQMLVWYQMKNQDNK